MNQDVSSKRTAVVCWWGFQRNAADAVVKFLLDLNWQVVTVQHPIFDTDRIHRISVLNPISRTRVIRRRWPIIMDNLISILIPIRLPRHSLFISFSCLSTARTILERRLLGRKVFVIHWNMDFSPRRYRNSMLNWVYNSLDKVSFECSDMQIDLTGRAQHARSFRYGVPLTQKNLVVPLGVNRSDIIEESALRRRLSTRNKDHLRLVFLGNVSRHHGILELLKGIDELAKSSLSCTLDVVGDGRASEESVALVDELGLRSIVTFHGQLEECSFRSILKESDAGLAPYLDSPDTFSRFADPGKVKEYLAAGLPVIVSNVPEIARTIDESRCGLVCEPRSTEIFRCLASLATNHQVVEEYSVNARSLAQRFTWEEILGDVLLTKGIVT